MLKVTQKNFYDQMTVRRGYPVMVINENGTRVLHYLHGIKFVGMSIKTTTTDDSQESKEHYWIVSK